MIFAYLDAATGSLIVAAVTGGVAGIAVLFRMYWRRFLGIFSKRHRLAAEADAAMLIGETDAVES